MNNDFENNSAEPVEESLPARTRFFKEIFEWLETFAFAFCFVLLVFTFLCRIVTVEGSSMYPTLCEKDRLVISDILYTPKTGDIIVFETDGHPDALIKRVIATEGQTVDIDFDSWTVTVDGVTLSEDYINFAEGNTMHDYGSFTYPHTVSEGKIFVMGDNRNASMDSRDPRIGEVNEEDVLGKVLIRLLPISAFGTVE